MATFTKLTKREKQELIVEFCQTLSLIKNSEEAAKFITDLLTPRETTMLSKRLKIAELLIKGKDYQTIRGRLKVGYSTIARVNTWLSLAGEGFKTILSRKRPPKEGRDPQDIYDSLSRYNFKRRYALYFWPQFIIEAIAEGKTKKERQKILSSLANFRKKSRVYNKQLNKKLYELFKNSKLGPKEIDQIIQSLAKTI
jgi:TrpR-related protein YerC/YecD